MNKFLNCVVLLFAPLALALGPTPAMADIRTFNASGTNSAGEAVGASATITTGAGVVTITLTNTDTPAQIRSVGDAVSDLSFTLSNNAGTLGAKSALGQQGNVTGPITLTPPEGGTVTYTTGSPGRFIGVGGGSLSTSPTSPTITLEALGGGQPSELILPSVPNSGTYANANSSIYGGQFNPFTIGTATFTLNLTGVTADTTVTNASFSFGTKVGETVLPGIATPEPATSLLVLTALVPVGVVGLIRHRRRRTTAPA